MGRTKTYEPKITAKTASAGVSYFLDYKLDGKRKTERVKQEACTCKGCRGAFEPTRCKHYRTAVAALDEWKRSGGGKAVTAKSSEFAEVAAWWERAVCDHKASSTRRSYLHTTELAREYGLTNLKQIDRAWLFDFRAWVGREREIEIKRGDKMVKVKKQRGSQGVNVHLRNLLALLNDAADDGRLATVPSHKGLLFQVQTKRTFLSPQEVERCLAADHHATDIFKLYYYTGLRLAELTNLTWDHVTKDRILIRERADWKPKWGIERDVPIHSEVQKVLEKLRANSTCAYVIATSNGTRYQESNLRRKVMSLYKECNVLGTHSDENVAIHTIRHTFASRLVNDLGTPLPIAMTLLGHRNLATTQRYLHSTFEGAVSAVAGL